MLREISRIALAFGWGVVALSVVIGVAQKDPLTFGAMIAIVAYLTIERLEPHQ